jgi:predicted transcriptional regulator
MVGCLDTTTATNTIIGTSWEQSSLWNLPTTKRYPSVSMPKYTNCGEEKMNKVKVVTNKVKTVTLTTGTLDEYVKRSKDRAKKLDRGEKLPAEFRITFEDPADLLRVISAERLRVLRTVRTRTKPTVSGLAIILKRDRRAVSRDVKLLEGLGLLRTRDEANPGHGVRTIVEPLAEKYHLEATV